MAPSSILSQTLQSITVTKVQELETKRKDFLQRKAQVLAAAEHAGDDVREKILCLHDGMKELDMWPEDDLDELGNIFRWVHQSNYDSSISENALLGFERKLRAKMEADTQKLDLADLYSRLLIEWTDEPKSGNAQLTPPSALEKEAADDSFDLVESIQKERLQQLRDKFEEVVLTPLETDEVEIDNYLSGLFTSEYAEASLKDMRQSVRDKGDSMLDNKKLFDRESLQWCIKSLLKVDLFDDEKKASLRDFLSDEDVLNEIRDVLNMRYANIQNWSWGLGERGMPVVPRQSPNGKWRVMMDDDVLQAIFTHWIGTIWAVELKGILQGIQKNTNVWKQNTTLPPEDRARRRYYLGSSAKVNGSRYTNLQIVQQEAYRNHFFLSPLPSKIFEGAAGYDDDDDDSDDEEERLSPKETKQLLLRTLATEFLVRRSLEGEAAVVQSDFQWFGTGLAHTSVFAVLRFMGFQEEWIAFFKKALEPPLDMLNGKPVRTRKRGLPMAHIFDKLLGEMVLVFMDLAVNQRTGMILYRFHDDLWLAGKPDQCARAWQTMQEFAKVMGLEFNQSKTGSVYFVEGEGRTKKPEVVKVLPEGPVVMNFMVLDPKSGNWVIDEEHVLQHIKQLQKQLAGCKSVLEWVKTWNSCIGRFFSYTFADPANCFGRVHVENTLETHKNIQATLFSSPNPDTPKTVTAHLIDTITTRFNPRTAISPAFLYLPETLGGLGLLNPFTRLFLVIDNLCPDPIAYLREYQEYEREQYEKLKTEFYSQPEYLRRRNYKAEFRDETDHNFSDCYVSTKVLPWETAAQEFMSFEEFVRWRDRASGRFCEVWAYLMRKPGKAGIEHPMRVDRALRAVAKKFEDPEDGLGRTVRGGRGRTGSGFGGRGGGNAGNARNAGAAGMGRRGLPDVHPRQMSEEMAWTVNFYAEEVFERFGGLELVDTGLLPLGVLKAMRGRMVTWQMVL